MEAGGAYGKSIRVLDWIHARCVLYIHIYLEIAGVGWPLD